MNTSINVSLLARCIHAYHSCNPEWRTKHLERITAMLDALPHGSGIDNGVKFLFDESNADRLVFTFGYHHLNGDGYYDGWTDHKLTIKPSLMFGYEMKITGQNRNDVKDYLYQVFDGVFYFDASEVLTHAEAAQQ